MKLIVLLLTCFFMSSCTYQKPQKLTLYAMDTIMDFTVYTDDKELLNKACEEIKKTEQDFSRFNENSDIYKLNNNNTAVLSPQTTEVIKTALSISKKTDGAFDISVSPVLELWGFYTKDYHIPTDKEISDTLPFVNYKAITVKNNTISIPKGMEIDLGGIAKGYASDKVTGLLKNNGVTSAIISLGGNVHAIGSKPDNEPWKVGIRNPFTPSENIATLSVSDKAVITSGGYERKFEENGKSYHHIIDPKTGKPAKSGLSSVTVISDNGIEADALSTALYVMGLDKGVTYWQENQDFDVIFITDDCKIHITPDLKDSIETKYSYSVIN